MSRYNHFSKIRYEQICFADLSIGDKFRMDKRGKGGRRRMDIIMLKTGSHDYEEMRSKKKYTLFDCKVEVSHFSNPFQNSRNPD